MPRGWRSLAVARGPSSTELLARKSAVMLAVLTIAVGAVGAALTSIWTSMLSTVR